MDTHKIYKIIEHLGEGTISDIEKKATEESQAIVNDIKGNLGIGEDDLSKELNLDDIIGKDLETLKTEKEEDKNQIFEEDKIFEREEQVIPEEQIIEKEQKEEANFEELDLSDLFGGEKSQEEEIVEKGKKFEDIKEVTLKEESEELDLGELELLKGMNEVSEEETIQERGKVEERKEESEELEETFNFEDLGELEGEGGEEEKIEEIVEEKGKEKFQTEETFEEEQFEEEAGVSLEELGEIGEEKKEEFKPYKDEFIDLQDLSEFAQIEENTKEAYDIELSDDDLEAIKTSLKTYPVWLSKHIKNLILNDALSNEELKTLLDMLITFANYKDVVNYLEKTLNIKVTPEEEVEEKIYIPSQFEIIWPYIKWTALSFFTLLISIILFYFYIYVPNEAKKFYQIGYKALQEENIEKAMENFRIAIKTKLYPDWILKYASELINRKYYNIAIDILKNPGLVFYPDDIRFYFLISDALFEMGEIDKSLRELEALYANVKFSKDPRLYLEYAKKYERLQDYKNAIIVYQDGIRRIRDRIEFLVGILKNYVELKDLKNSDIYYQKISKKDKNFIDSNVFTNYAFLLLKNNYDTEGKEIIERVIKKDKYFSKAYYFLGIYYIKRKDVNLAMKNLEQAEKYNKLNKNEENILPFIYNLEGEIIMNMGYKGIKDSSLASEKFILALNENNKFAKAYFNLGKIYYFEINDYKKAYEYISLAKKYGYENDFSNYILAWIAYQLGNYIESLKNFLFLHNKYLDDVNLKSAVGLNFLRLNQPEIAIGYFESAIGSWELNKMKVKKIDVNNPDVRNILINLAVLYNNIGVAYFKLYKQTKNKDYSILALKYFLKSKEEYSWLSPNAIVNSEAYVNTLNVLHSDINRELLIMDSFQYFPKIIFEDKDLFYY